MITNDEARAIAIGYISRMPIPAPGIPLAIDDRFTREEKFGWVFAYNSKLFMENGDPRYMLSGNLPIIVFRDGQVGRLPRRGSYDASIAAFLEDWSKKNGFS